MDHRSLTERGAVCINLLTMASNPLATADRLLAHWIFIDELPDVCQKNSIRRIDQVTNSVFNSLALTRSGHQVFTPYPFTALACPSFPSSPGTSTLINCRSEASLTVDNSAESARRSIGTSIIINSIHSRCQCMSFGYYIIPWRLLSDDGHRPADNIRHVPRWCLARNILFLCRRRY